MTPVRRAGTASVAALSVLVSILAATHTVVSDWMRAVGLDIWNLPALHESQRIADEEAIAVDAIHEQTFRRMETCGHLAAALVAGRTTLSQAVDEMEPLLRTAPGFRSAFELHYRVPTFRHGVARYAISRVQFLLQPDPSRWAEVSKRLEAEYAAMK